MRLLIDEQIGDINKPNILGYLPNHIEHKQPLQNLPQDIVTRIPTTIQEIQEADYLILSTEDKKDLVLDQLKDLNLYNKEDSKENYVNQFPFVKDEFDYYNFFTCKGKKKFLRKKKLCAISIKIPNDMLLDKADEMKIETPISQSWYDFFVKAPYNKLKYRNYNSFSATENQKIIMDGILSRELNFRELLSTGVIIDHFPLHKRKLIQKMQFSFDHYYKNLRQGFYTDKYKKYMQPLNLIKNYYGENYAFEYAFLIHYQAWLQIPTIVGITLTFYQVYRYFEHKDIVYALDTPFNAIFGFFVIFWAICFVESWKRK